MPLPPDWRERAPQHQAALLFMDNKGLAHVEPIDVEKEARGQWMFFYDIPDADGGGHLDLSVRWLYDDKRWDVHVYDFYLGDEPKRRTR